MRRCGVTFSVLLGRAPGSPAADRRVAQSLALLLAVLVAVSGAPAPRAEHALGVAGPKRGREVRFHRELEGRRLPDAKGPEHALRVGLAERGPQLFLDRDLQRGLHDEGGQGEGSGLRGLDSYVPRDDEVRRLEAKLGGAQGAAGHGRDLAEPMPEHVA